MNKLRMIILVFFAIILPSAILGEEKMNETNDSEIVLKGELSTGAFRSGGDAVTAEVQGNVIMAIFHKDVGNLVVSLINSAGECSTISSFNDKETLGELNAETGQINWDLTKMAYWFKDLTQKECEECKWFPACLGPCNKQLLAQKGKFICTFDAMNMNAKEYLMYSFKYQLLKEELSKVFS